MLSFGRKEVLSIIVAPMGWKSGHFCQNVLGEEDEIIEPTLDKVQSSMQQLVFIYELLVSIMFIGLKWDI